MSNLTKPPEDNSISARVNNIRSVLMKNADAIFAALPKHITADRMLRLAVTSIRRNPALLDCTRDSLFGAICDASTLGLEIDGTLGHAYLVPFKHQCTLIPGYKGLLKLVHNTGTVKDITCEVVYACDKFEYRLGDDARIEHIPACDREDREDQPIRFVYLVVRLLSGGMQRRVWSKSRIDRHGRKYSQAYKKGKPDSAWVTDWESMAKKTLIREMVNRGLLPVSVELARMMAREEEIDRYTASQDDGSLTIENDLDSLTDRVQSKAIEGKTAEQEPDPEQEPKATPKTKTMDPEQLFDAHESATEAGM
jgi:recombination protein RecT